MAPQLISVGGQTRVTWAVRGRKARNTGVVGSRPIPATSPPRSNPRAKSCPLRTFPAPPSITRLLFGETGLEPATAIPKSYSRSSRPPEVRCALLVVVGSMESLSSPTPGPMPDAAADAALDVFASLVRSRHPGVSLLPLRRVGSHGPVVAAATGQVVRPFAAPEDRDALLDGNARVPARDDDRVD